jgi:hypothetical protein
MPIFNLIKKLTLEIYSKIYSFKIRYFSAPKMFNIMLIIKFYEDYIKQRHIIFINITRKNIECPVKF